MAANTYCGSCMGIRGQVACTCAPKAAAEWRKIIATYAARCLRCKGAIQPGTAVNWLAGVGTAHAKSKECQPAAAAVATAHTTTTSFPAAGSRPTAAPRTNDGYQGQMCRRCHTVCYGDCTA